MVVIHVLCDPCDAMGANIINQVCEALKAPLERISGHKVSMCILSNLVDTRLTKAVVEVDGVEEAVGIGIEEASRFAEHDPYRAATNNKGVLNGIDPIVVATGNDWRAVEAGVHAFAARDGRYSSITQWRYSNGTLTGTLIAPIIVGTVGGVTKLHPTAQMCIRMLGVKSAEELSRILAAVGLIQNLGALKALSTVGVVAGHMKLHAANLALMAGAEHHEMEIIQRELEQILKLERRVSLSNAIDALSRLRMEKEKNLADLGPQ
jgi:hydroxymethylglutaryl-CoA reductase